MAFITNTQFLLYCDKYRVAEYVSDDETGEPVDVSTLGTDPVLTEFLAVATGQILQAARVGARYSLNDLTSLAADPVSGGPLRALCAALAYGLLVIRKGYNAGDLARLAPNYAPAMASLQLIYTGERLFDTGPILDPAGVTETGPLQPSPPNAPYTTQIACGYFGNTGFRIWPGGWGPGPGQAWPGCGGC